MARSRKPRFVHSRIEYADFEKVKVIPLLTCDQVFSTLHGHPCDILVLLALVGPLCVGEISVRLKLCVSVVSRALRRLLCRKLVRYERDLNSHRFQLGDAIVGRSSAGWAQLGIQLPNGDWLLLKRPGRASARCDEAPRFAHADPKTDSVDPAAVDPRVHSSNALRKPEAALDVPWNQVLFLFSGHRYEILTLVALQGQMQSGEIARRLGVNTSSVSRALKSLRTAQLLDPVGELTDHRYQSGQCLHAEVTSAYVRLLVRMLDSSWMLVHREEFSDSDRAIPMPTDWLDDPLMLPRTHSIGEHVRIDEGRPENVEYVADGDKHGRSRNDPIPPPAPAANHAPGRKLGAAIDRAS